MPSIVVTPKYNPFTFDELYRPLAETTKMQMALEDQYNAMEMEAAKLDYLEKSDKDAYAIVKNYEDTLRGLAGELASNGLTPQSRQGVYDMRKAFASDISPINKYISWREAQDKARQEIMMKDPTYRWEIPLDQIKYNNWKDNPDMLFRGLSGDTLAKMTQASIQHVTKKWKGDSDFKKLDNTGLKDYWQKIENYGLDVEDLHTLRKAIENSSELTAEEKKALENKMNQAALDVRDEVINSTDIPQWSNYKDLEDENSPLFKWVNSNIQRGLWAGIGEQKDQVLHDANAEAERKKRETINVNDLSWGPIVKEGITGMSGIEGLNSFYQTYKDMFNNEELKDSYYNDKYMGIKEGYYNKREVEHNMQYKNENGAWVDNWVFGHKRNDGKVEIDVNDPLSVVAYYLSHNRKEDAVKFIHTELPEHNSKIIIDDYIKSHNSYQTKDKTKRWESDDKYLTNKDLGITKKSLEDAWKLINEEVPESNYDAKASTRYRWNLDSSNTTEFKNNLVRAIFNDIGGKQGETFDIPIVDYSYTDKQYKDTGDAVSSEDFMKATPQSIAFSKQGMIVTMVNENGGSFNVKLPNNINRDVVNNIYSYFENAQKIAKKRDDYITKYNLVNKNVNNWTEAEINDMLDFYNRFTNNINNANVLIANIIGVNKVKPVEYEQSNKPSYNEAFNTNQLGNY